MTPRSLLPICVVLGAVCVAEPARAEESALIDAYKKEFAFLEAEKSALKQRLTEVDKEAQAKIAAARGGVESLQQQILGLRARADDIETELSEVEEETMRTCHPFIRLLALPVVIATADSTLRAGPVQPVRKIAEW